MNIILFGPPGAGKGTQSDKLVDDFKLFKVSTGDLIREEINKNSLLGKEMKSAIDKGLLVSDEIIDKLILNIVSKKKYSNKLIFDGYPRNINQAVQLDKIIKKYEQNISCVLSIKVNFEIIKKRILGRMICSKCGLIFNKYFNPPPREDKECSHILEIRSDDNEKTLEKRFKTYLNISMPILDYYQNQNILHEVDGNGEISSIYKEISDIIKGLETWL